MPEGLKGRMRCTGCGRSYVEPSEVALCWTKHGKPGFQWLLDGIRTAEELAMHGHDDSAMIVLSRIRDEIGTLNSVIARVGTRFLFTLDKKVPE